MSLCYMQSWGLGAVVLVLHWSSVSSSDSFIQCKARWTSTQQVNDKQSSIFAHHLDCWLLCWLFDSITVTTRPWEVKAPGYSSPGNHTVTSWKQMTVFTFGEKMDPIKEIQSFRAFEVMVHIFELHRKPRRWYWSSLVFKVDAAFNIGQMEHFF